MSPRPLPFLLAALALFPLASADVAKGVVVLGVCGGGGEEKMNEVAQKAGMTYPSAKTTPATTQAWKVQWWPTYAVVDRKGNLRALGLQPDYVEKVIDALLEEQP